MLAGGDEVAGAGRRRLHERVARHTHRLAEGHRGDTVAVEPGAAVGEFVGRQVKIAVWFLHREQEFEAAADRVAVLAAEVIVARPQKTQDCQARGSRVAGELGGVGRGAPGERPQPPAAVGLLRPCEEVEPAIDHRIGRHAGLFTNGQLARRLFPAAGIARGA